MEKYLEDLYATKSVLTQHFFLTDEQNISELKLLQFFKVEGKSIKLLNRGDFLKIFKLPLKKFFTLLKKGTGFFPVKKDNFYIIKIKEDSQQTLKRIFAFILKLILCEKCTHKDTQFDEQKNLKTCSSCGHTALF
jgi:hypothetical protein